MTNALSDERRVSREVQKILASRLPNGWTTQWEPFASGPGLSVRLEAPDGQVATLVAGVKRTIEPRQVPDAIAQLRAYADGPTRAVPMLIAAYLSPRSRSVLQEAGVNYAESRRVDRRLVGC